jgi:hypothetical protein
VVEKRRENLKGTQNRSNQRKRGDLSGDGIMFIGYINMVVIDNLYFVIPGWDIVLFPFTSFKK